MLGLVWNESRAGHDSNKITFCLFHFLTKKEFVYRTEIKLWDANCCGQNKNKIIIFMLLWCVLSEYYCEIGFSLLVSGNTYLSSDRDFGTIGNQKKMMVYTPKDIRKMIKETRVTGNQFTVTNVD